MGSELGLLAACLVVLGGCGKTASNDGEGGSASESTSDSVGAGGSGTIGSVGGQGGGATTTTALTTQGVTTGAPVCALPEERECQGECVNLRTSSDHCGSCSNVCTQGYECVLARCARAITCGRAPARHAAVDMDASGGVELDDGWLLATGETLSLEHAFADGPAVLLLTARGLDGEPRPYVSVTIGESSLEPLLLRATSHATYSLEHD